MEEHVDNEDAQEWSKIDSNIPVTGLTTHIKCTEGRFENSGRGCPWMDTIMFSNAPNSE